MIIIPAIDLKDGQCVRLAQGRKNEATVYSHDPAETARRWASAGAELIHIVDLDGAFTGSQQNLEGIRKIRKAVNVALEVGGGIRGEEQVRILLAEGIERVILGTTAVRDPDLVSDLTGKYPGCLLAGIDARDGFVAVQGWIEVTDMQAKSFALAMQERGVAGIIYTDISRDGMLTGPNIEATREMAEALSIPVIASGGISSMEDIRRLHTIAGLGGAITGKAIYEGTLDLGEAIRFVRERGNG